MFLVSANCGPAVGNTHYFRLLVLWHPPDFNFPPARFLVYLFFFSGLPTRITVILLTSPPYEKLHLRGHVHLNYFYSMLFLPWLLFLLCLLLSLLSSHIYLLFVKESENFLVIIQSEKMAKIFDASLSDRVFQFFSSFP